MNNEVINAVNVLKFEGTVLYPTDTIWGIGCDALSDIAVEKIFKIKKREYSKSLICLASSFKMFQEYVSIKEVYELETFYGDQTLLGLLNHAISFNEQLETFEYVYSLTEEENDEQTSWRKR